MIPDILNPFPQRVGFVEEGHKYYDLESGQEYMSASKLRSFFKVPFNSEMISKRSAMSALKAGGLEQSVENVDRVAKEYRNGWDNYSKERADMGTRFHKAMELYMKLGKILPEDLFMAEHIKKLSLEFKKFYRNYCEVVVYSDRSNVAGTGDVMSLHSKYKPKVIHLNDYKSNKKGITNDFEYGKRFTKGLDHLIENKYTDYSLQQSLYGAMLVEHGYEIATINLVEINIDCIEMGDLDFYEFIPVPFMKYEADYMINYSRSVIW